MNYDFILKDLKPNQEEIDSVAETTNKVIDHLNQTCKVEGIDGKAMAVGSVAKNTWLKGKSDIDIFIHFPLDMNLDELKEKGLYLAYKTNDALEGVASEHYASHPYLTCDIDGKEVDIVPCYSIEDGSQLRSAVDRTILHTRYIQKHLLKEQENEVLLLKRFMDCVGTYGSEFKTGGFAGYLCELLILKYKTFENTLKNATDWKFHTIIDLENYGTANNKLFKNDALVMIDPTDKNRNVGAALRTERMLDFIIASRNFLKILEDENLEDFERKEKVKEYFNPLIKKQFINEDCLNKNYNQNDSNLSLSNIEFKSNNQIALDLLNQFKDRETQTLIIKFPIPEMSADSLHPQLLKTIESLCEKIENEEFSVFNYDYWTDEENIVIFTIELNVFKQSKYYIHEGPKVWNKIAFENFSKKWGENIYNHNEFLVLQRERQFKTVKDLIKFILMDENIRIIKVGKNIKDSICNCYELFEVDEFFKDLDLHFNIDNNINIKDVNDTEEILDLEYKKSLQFDYLNSVDDILNPGQYVKR